MTRSNGSITQRLRRQIDAMAAENERLRVQLDAAQQMLARIGAQRGRDDAALAGIEAVMAMRRTA